MDDAAQPRTRAEAARPGSGDGALVATVDAWTAAYLARRLLPEDLAGALRYALLGGGKRVRPLLALRACEAAGGAPTAALPAAAAVELVHTFSLVHDDLPALDDDELRRGRPTLHRHAGEALAILAGDALLALAFEVLAREVEPSDLRGRLCAELATATNDMIAGQVHDTLGGFDDGVAPLERLRTTHRLKTGALIRCACRMGALCAGARDAELEALSRYGEAVGLMFQVVDDLLDVTGTTEQLGKRANKDSAHAKLTYPALLGLDASRAEVQRLRAEALAALAPLGPRAAPLAELCERLAVRTR